LFGGRFRALMLISRTLPRRHFSAEIKSAVIAGCLADQIKPLRIKWTAARLDSYFQISKRFVSPASPATNKLSKLLFSYSFFSIAGKQSLFNPNAQLSFPPHYAKTMLKLAQSFYGE